MKIEWDPEKAKSNLKKHRVNFADAVFALEDERALTIKDACIKEERFITLGLDCFGRLIVIVYMFHDDCFRIISARKATKKEHQQYESDL